MKEMTVPRTIMKRVYIAYDHTEFETQEDCLKYEEEHGEDNNIVESLPSFELTPDFTADYEKLEWFYVSSDREVEAVKRTIYDSGADVHEFECKSFPRWIVCEHDGDGYGWIYNGLDEIREQIREYCEKVEECQKAELNAVNHEKERR